MYFELAQLHNNKLLWKRGKYCFDVHFPWKNDRDRNKNFKLCRNLSDKRNYFENREEGTRSLRGDRESKIAKRVKKGAGGSKPF